MEREFTLARMSVDGKIYELVVKPEMALAYREGKISTLTDVLISDTVFSDANKGIRVSNKDLVKSFGTTDVEKISETIIKKGILQLTSQQRKQMIEEKRRQIITFISRQAYDPRTKMPHPPKRIEQALIQIRFSVDPFKSVEKQAEDAINSIRTLIPISIEKISVSIKIPAQYTGKAYGVVKSYGTIMSESWQSDGSWSTTISIAAGLYGSFLEKIGDITKGNVATKISD